MSGDTLILGIPSEGGSASGVNGGPPDNLRPGSGAVVVLVRNGTNWVEQAYLKASNPGNNDAFGHAVAISGDTLAVSAISEDSNATGINGNQADNSAEDSGAVYVFVRDGTTWSQQAYLKASNAEAFDYFGFSVAIFGETLVVGALQEDSNATGINGDQNDNSMPNSGAAYVFVRNGTTWTQQAYLKASDPGMNHLFGSAVGISFNTIVIGATRAPGTSFFQAGAAYVFVRNGSSWAQQALFGASNADGGDQFGAAVAIAGDTVVVGAPGEGSNAIGVNGNENDNSLYLAGAAYAFVRNGTTWSQQAYLKASNTGATDEFGTSVAVHGDIIIVGAPGEASNATGVNGNQANNTAFAAGAAYVFSRTGTTWNQPYYLKPDFAASNLRFGSRLALTEDWVAVGGGSGASAFLFADQEPEPPPPPSLPSRIESIEFASAAVTLKCSGQPDVMYNLLRRPDFDTDWSWIDAQVAEADGTFTSVDTDPLPDGAFYVLERVEQ